MQELAARLGDPAISAKTETALLQFLRSRMLEAEVVEVLCIFWIAARGYGYSPVDELVNSVPKPSPLSDLFLDDLGLPISDREARFKEVPGEFEIPDDFDGVNGVDLPRIFRTSLGRLDDHTGLPFVRQMAYEWAKNRTAYPDAPYQGDPWHFTRPLGRGFSSQHSSRTAVRAISAYLCTLAVAETVWSMPTHLADQEALLALPVHPTLALLRPMRPAWFPDRSGFDGDTTAVEAAIRVLLDRVKAVRPNDELIAFSSPVVMTMERCVEVSLVRWSQAAGSQVDDATLAKHLEDFWRRGHVHSHAGRGALSTTTILIPPAIEKLLESKSKAWPLARTLDFDRMGYLQLDLYPGRLFVPTLPAVDQIELAPSNGQLEVKVADQVVADLCYWNAGWGPARPVQLSGNCGEALVSRGTAYRENAIVQNASVRAFYLWKVRTLHRTSSLDEFSETLATGAVFV
jgi:hypothetical protein